MLEFALVIPLIAFVIAAVFFFAWGLRNRMGMEMSDRYLTWWIVRGANFPVRLGPTPHDIIMRGLLMDRTVKDMYGNWYDEYEDTKQTLRDLSKQTNDYSPEAGAVAQELLLDSWPLGNGVLLTATFPTPAGVWEKLSGEYQSRYIRDGVEWRCGQASNEKELTSEFQRELDETMKSAGQLGAMLRPLYRDPWPRRDK